MKTKIIMMSALLALLATGCEKVKTTDGHMKIVAEKMAGAGNSKLVVNPGSLAMEWLADEIIKINNANFTIEGDNTTGYRIDINNQDLGDTYYALYPGDDFSGNDVTISGTNAAPVITLNRLVIDMQNDGRHHVVFPMGAKATLGDEQMTFKHLTAGFRLSLQAATPVTVKTLKVYVFGDSETTLPVDDANTGIIYTVKWNTEGQMPSLPVGPVGGLDDQDISFGSEMVFDMKTAGADGVEFGTEAKSFCVPVTLTSVKRITVVGYNDDTQVFAKTHEMASPVTLERHIMYPVETISIN